MRENAVYGNHWKYIFQKNILMGKRGQMIEKLVDLGILEPIFRETCMIDCASRV